MPWTLNTGSQVNSELQDSMLTGSSLHSINRLTRHKEGALTKFGHWSIAGQITASEFFNNVPTLARWKMVTQIWTGEFQCQNHVLKETAKSFPERAKGARIYTFVVKEQNNFCKNTWLWCSILIFFLLRKINTVLFILELY